MAERNMRDDLLVVIRTLSETRTKSRVIPCRITSIDSEDTNQSPMRLYSHCEGAIGCSAVWSAMTGYCHADQGFYLAFVDRERPRQLQRHLHCDHQSAGQINNPYGPNIFQLV